MPGDPAVTSAEEDRRQIVRAATVVMTAFILSRLLGLVRQRVIGLYFGTSADLDAYLAAFRIPDLIFQLMAGGALGSAFIPTFTGYLARGDRPGAWRLASAVINLLLVTLTGSALLAGLTAPWLVATLIAPGFPPAQQQLTVALMRVMLLSTIVFGVSGVVMGALNAYQHFLLPAVAPMLYNLGIIGGAVLLSPTQGVMGLAVGVVVGAALHLLVQVPSLLRFQARYTPLLTLRDPGVQEVLRLMAPRVLGLAVVQVNFLVNTNLASRLGEGPLSALNYAWLLMLLPQGVFAQAVGTAAFPTFAEQVARGEVRAMRSALAATLRAVFALSIPAAVGLALLREPLIGLLFRGGAFQEASVQMVAWPLLFYALGLVGHAGLEIVTRAFYAMHDTKTPVLVGGLAMGLNLLFSLAFLRLFAALGWMPHGGLALANSLATLLETGGLLLILRARLQGLEGRRLLAAVVQSGMAAGAMAVALVGLRIGWQRAGVLIHSLGGMALGATIYGSVMLALGNEEVQAIGRRLGGRWELRQ